MTCGGPRSNRGSSALLAGLLRQSGGFRLALRGLFLCLCLFGLPLTFYARRAVEAAVRAMRFVSRPRHALLPEARHEWPEWPEARAHHPAGLVDGVGKLSGVVIDEQLLLRAASSRVRPNARPFHTRRPGRS